MAVPALELSSRETGELIVDRPPHSLTPIRLEFGETAKVRSEFVIAIRKRITGGRIEIMTRSSLIYAVLTTAVAAMCVREGGTQQSSENVQLRKEVRTILALSSQVPDRGAVFYYLAVDYALLGDSRKAISYLQQCTHLREGFDPAEDPAFESLRAEPEFQSLVRQVLSEFPKKHSASWAFSVAQKDLIPEGLAVDPRSHRFYMSGTNRRKIVSIAPNGAVSDFVSEATYNLQSVCGIRVDWRTEDVWANTCPENGEGAELLHFDVQGKLLERFPASGPGPHLFNDLVLQGSAAVYLTDSLANEILRFDRRTHAFTTLALPRQIYYPNGIALSDDQRALYIADAFGVFRYDLQTHAAREVLPGPSTTISGFDGLYWYRGSLVGIQNSLGSSRVVQFRLSPDGSHVTRTNILEYRTDYVKRPTTGAIDNGILYFMTNTESDHWKDNKISDPQNLAPIRVAAISLPAE